MGLKVTVIVEKDGHGYYAYCPQLSGCHSQGDTFEDVMRNIREAIELYVETMDKEEKRMLLSGDVYTAQVEVPFDAEVA